MIVTGDFLTGYSTWVNKETAEINHVKWEPEVKHVGVENIKYWQEIHCRHTEMSWDSGRFGGQSASAQKEEADPTPTEKQKKYFGALNMEN